MYIITKKFTNGILKGLTIQEKTLVRFILNKNYDNYIITDIKEVIE